MKVGVVKGKRGKSASSKNDVTWVECDTCEHWYHCFCIGVECEDFVDRDFKCDFC